MAEDSTFRGTIEFLVKLGVYDVVLPFLLVFTIVFAILEKTKVLGTDTIGEKKEKHPKRNLNSMVAFCIAFFVILSRELVATINEAMANIVVLLLVIISFLLLAGSFQKETEDPYFLESPWNIIFMVIMFVGVVLVFLHAIPIDNGNSNWLEYGWGWLEDHWNVDWFGAIVFVLAMAGFMFWITKPPSSGNKEEKK